MPILQLFISLFTSINYTTLVFCFLVGSRYYFICSFEGAHDFVKSVMKILIFLLSSLVLTTLHGSIVYMTILLSLSLDFVIETYESIWLYCMSLATKFVWKSCIFIKLFILFLFWLMVCLVLCRMRYAIWPNFIEASVFHVFIVTVFFLNFLNLYKMFSLMQNRAYKHIKSWVFLNAIFKC
jgi:hypothetical protein